MFRDSHDHSHENDYRFEEKVSRRNQPVRRPKAARRRAGKSSTGGGATLGGIRQRRNKRWSW